MPEANALARPRASLLTLLAQALSSDAALSMLGGAVLISFFHYLQHLWSKWKSSKSEQLWRRRVDLDVVQACILTTEHLQTLGRIEKRTLFVKPVSEVFRNEYILERILEEAEKASPNEMIMTRLSQEDKWFVLNTCSNHLSSCFAPYHVFFNEARRNESYYKSAWYCFTLTCGQTAASGRWFITPHNPVGKGDIGVRRIRILMMNEQELRDVASGDIAPPAFGLFNDRHTTRWDIVARFADLFERQLQHGEDGDVAGLETNKPVSLSRGSSGTALPSLEEVMSKQKSSEGQTEYAPEDNSILRLHVPFPASRDGKDALRMQREDCVSKDVVLYE